MELREKNAKLRGEVQGLKAKNKKLTKELSALTDRASADCQLIIKQVDELDKLQKSLAQSKSFAKQMQSKLKEAGSTFKQMLAIKMKYE